MKPLIALTVVGLSCVALALSACGESEADEAQSDVCDARSDISAHIDSLKSLTIGSSTTSDVTAALTAIRNDLQKIVDAQPNLDSDRKEQVQNATKAFGTQLQQIARDTVAGLSTGDAKTQVQSALTSLGTAYEQALKPISC